MRRFFNGILPTILVLLLVFTLFLSVSSYTMAQESKLTPESKETSELSKFTESPLNETKPIKSITDRGAGDEATANSATTETEPSSQESDQQKLDELNRLYTNQIEAYRTAEREYNIAKKQYLELKTLKLLEESVNSTKTALIARNNVLLTYLELHYFTLRNETGINLKYKDDAVKKLERQIDVLRKYGKNLEKITDRDELKVSTDEFQTIYPEVEATAYRSLTLMSLGRLQAIHDKAQGILKDMKKIDASEINPDFSEAKYNRALVETEKNLNNLRDQLKKMNTNYEDDRKTFSKTSYEIFVEKLNTVYSDLFQIISYLNELLTI